MMCGLCGCVIYPGEDETFDSQFGIVGVLCYRALEIHGRIDDIEETDEKIQDLIQLYRLLWPNFKCENQIIEKPPTPGAKADSS